METRCETLDCIRSRNGGMKTGLRNQTDIPSTHGLNKRIVERVGTGDGALRLDHAPAASARVARDIDANPI